MDEASLNIRNKIIELTGIKALHPKEDFRHNIKSNHNSEGVMTSCVIWIFSKFFTLYKIRISFSQKTIENLIIVSSGIQKGVAKPCLEYQVKKAYEFKFKYIELLADRCDHPSYYEDDIRVESLIGYKIWGKYGFIMTEILAQKKFENLMRTQNLSFRMIGEIYEDTIDGENARNKWNDKGFPWFGIFSLDKDSSSFNTLFRSNTPRYTTSTSGNFKIKY
ncbi:hypothetical protein LZF95_19565 [Algoriphagus sp. AGSA1]|uniref:hypothetical protein n=1 Tax=Algoriphagus sp. AGSA1 TaxID=2907213 RepID=UPI001F3263F8|nr:hypothetical protein [Algoriphagus sp. AGSA1]MCE7056887.1 hypothetical protein [Algoriphagus sp. AGSA1]